MHRLESRGINLSYDDVNTLRRAQITLHGWAELECGGSDNVKSYAIERDDVSGLPYMCTYPHDSAETRRRRIPDREKGALRRVAAICAKAGIYFYHQTDPRGCSLYVSTSPIVDHNYIDGIALA
jgi:hypothetical protein